MIVEKKRDCFDFFIDCFDFFIEKACIILKYLLQYSLLKRAYKMIAELCNGSTTDSDSVCWGSNPYSAAKEKIPKNPLFSKVFRDFCTFV